MSIFKKSLKTFTTNITGEELELKINNAVWLIMETKFGMTQKQYVDQYEEKENIVSSKFVAAVLIANGHKTTDKEVLENTDPSDLMAFTIAYSTAVQEKFGDILGEGVEDGEEGNEKKE